MTKYSTLILSILILSSCRSNTENKVDKSVRLFKEASTSMMAGFKLEISGSDSSKLYYRQAINKFLESYLLDTTHLELAIYLPDLYHKINEFDSAALWKSKMRPIDSINNLNIPEHTQRIYGPPNDSTKLKVH